MNRELLIKNIHRIFSLSESNRFSSENALLEELISAQIFDEPIVGIADACNYKFTDLKNDDIIGWHHLLPVEWLSGATSVISIFFPFSSMIRKSNYNPDNYPSKGWLNGRIEGSHLLMAFLVS